MISIHALREEGDAVASGPLITTINDISIHALREEGDRQRGSSSDGAHYFYPRPPRGGRRDQGVVLNHDLRISIHALREEGDEPSPASPATWTYFYPRPPRGGRRPTAC